ncbi:putative Cold-regulated 413 plasma membrane protein [Cocos nucifera]|uniref:Putative Cold-regulated 413 plasma membrane protein n=1 Tax=Cocos nucifera TaxID=13894 RepID=A0A8K0IVS5_COCNU|nr:putative Cold-regulated 413 plasma membrane protein [Cocos nucifera]
MAAKKLAKHAFKLGSGLGFGTTFFKFLASFAAIGDFGKWIAFIAVVLRLFFPRHFPDWLEMPGSLILLLVVAPSLFAHTIRNSLIGIFICLAIGCYLLQEHIRASGGFRNSFTKRHGISNSIVYLVHWISVYSFVHKTQKSVSGCGNFEIVGFLSDVVFVVNHQNIEIYIS